MPQATRSATPATAAALIRHAKSDYDGDGLTDIAVFRPSTTAFYALRSSNGTLLAFQFGLPGDIPLSGDYDGDGITDIAVYRPSTATFYALRSSNGTLLAFQFGAPGDIPLSGDYDGDGITDVAVYSPSTNTFYALRSSNGTVLAFQFGSPGDLPLSGDYDGDGIMDIAVYRPSTSTFYALRSSNGTLLAFAFGAPGDIPLSGDYDGDGITDFAVYRPSTNTFYALRTSNGTLLALQFGSSGDIPLSAYGGTSIQITGQVTAGGTGVSGVTVTLSGDISTSTTTDSNGNYSFAVPAGGSYTATPSDAGYSFSSAACSFDGLDANGTAPFAAISNALSSVPVTTLQTYTGSGPYRIINVFSSKALDVNVSSGGIVQQWDYMDEDSQKWFVTYNSDGTYNLSNKYAAGEMFADPSQISADGDPVGDSDAVIAIEELGSSVATWHLAQQADGTYVISNALDGKAVTVSGNALSNGLPVQLWGYAGDFTQRWVIQSVSSTSTGGTGGSNGSQGTPSGSSSGSIPPLPSQPTPLTDISGTWVDDSVLSGTWTLSQNGSEITGTLTGSYGSCPPVSWTVTGSANDGQFNLVAENPSPSFDTCSGRVAATVIYSTITSLSTAGSGLEQTLDVYPAWTGLSWPTGLFSFTNQNRQSALSDLRNEALNLQNNVISGIENSCEALADFAQIAAAQDGVSNNAFVSDFQVLTPNQTIVKLVPGVYGRNDFVPLDYGGLPTGFAPQYVDSQIPNSDQGHHFAGYFQLGYAWTALAGTISGPVYEFVEVSCREPQPATPGTSI